eukprot:1845454-Lingulodinium_polyedra.AAC.1
MAIGGGARAQHDAGGSPCGAGPHQPWGDVLIARPRSHGSFPTGPSSASDHRTARGDRGSLGWF